VTPRRNTAGDEKKKKRITRLGKACQSNATGKSVELGPKPSNTKGTPGSRTQEAQHDMFQRRKKEKYKEGKRDTSSPAIPAGEDQSARKGKWDDATREERERTPIKKGREKSYHPG